MRLNVYFIVLMFWNYAKTKGLLSNIVNLCKLCIRVYVPDQSHFALLHYRLSDLKNYIQLNVFSFFIPNTTLNHYTLNIIPVSG